MTSDRYQRAGTRERNLGLELVRVTEAAAFAASAHLGRGDKEAVDQAAVDAMRSAIEGVDMHGVVVIGEGEKDEAPMLFVGEEVGNGLPPEVDVAVDPVDGTRLTAMGLPGLSRWWRRRHAARCSRRRPGLLHGKAGGRARRRPCDRSRSADERKPATYRCGAWRTVGDVTVTVLDRPRHGDYHRGDS